MSTQRKTATKPWVPPPALTTASDRHVKGRKRLKSKPGSCASKIEAKLENLLRDIQEIKQKSNEIRGRSFDQETPGQKIEDVENAILKAVEELQVSSQEKSVLEKTLFRMKNELKSNLAENEKLRQRQVQLMQKLGIVEKNATEAVKHVYSLRQFINALSQSDIREAKDGKLYTREVYAKLGQLDEANQSLQRVIHTSIDASGDNIPQEESKGPPISLVTEQVKHLQTRLEEDRRHIFDLKAKVHQVKSAANTEKQALKKIVRSQKERANKYLSSYDALKSQMSLKNNEINELKQEIHLLKLHNCRMSNEIDRLEIERNSIKVSSVIQTSKDPTMTSQFQNGSSKGLIMSHYDSGNEKLELGIESDESEKEEQKSYEQQSSHHATLAEKADKSAQVTLDKIPDSTPVGGSINEDGNEDETSLQWKQMSDMWQQLQADKLVILKTLKELEQKLERSQNANSDFQQQLILKDEILQQINLRFKEKSEENKSLRKLLEAALVDAKTLSDQADRRSRTLDQAVESKIIDMQRELQERKAEITQLKKANLEMEKKHQAQISEFQERLDLADKSKKTMHDYIAFLKNSYTTVFGNGSLAVKEYNF